MLSALVLLATAAATTPPANGAALYQRCAVCHQPDGAGIPGTFPPLDAHVRAFARTKPGRQYLVLVLARGVAGAITVEGKRFMGVMPAQSTLDDAGIAHVLNHVLATVASGGEDPQPFTAAEVKKIRATNGNPGPADVAKLRSGLASP